MQDTQHPKHNDVKQTMFWTLDICVSDFGIRYSDWRTYVTGYLSWRQPERCIHPLWI